MGKRYARKRLEEGLDKIARSLMVYTDRSNVPPALKDEGSAPPQLHSVATEASARGMSLETSPSHHFPSYTECGGGSDGKSEAPEAEVHRDQIV